jgi:PAS domain S-box-containing protein
MATLDDDEDQLLRSVALQNANSILLARHRAEAELLQAKEALRQNEERLRAIFNQAAVGIAVASLDGRFLDMNAKFTQILGYSAAELSGLSFAALTHPDDQDITDVFVAELLAGKRSEYALEKRFIRKDGSSIWSLTTVTLLKDPTGSPQRFIGVIEDISARKRAEAALLEKTRNLEQLNQERTMLLESERAARTAAERMSEMKDEFLATLSHELRTPLNAILGWSQVLRTGSKDQADYVKGLETIERNARVQTQLIEDLLDMSRITSGKLRMDVQRIQPLTLVEAAVETVTPAANAKGICLEAILDPAAGPISGDPGRLQQVVWNLLSNAIKFTPRDGKVQVVLQRINSHIEIKVGDTGIGIRPEFIPHLFERFRQGDASTTRKYGGLGLGLSIVKSLVELHGGTVSVSSEGEGKGTIVTVALPLTAVHQRADDAEREHPKTERAAVTRSPAVAELAGLKVLVVDDQRDARDLVKRVLEDSGAEVFPAGSAAEALAVLAAWRPDVLVSDIGMPEVDGYELVRKIRAISAENGGKIPAIALTAFARSEDRTRALRAGFTVHVSKPVDPAELVATVASVAGRVTDSWW